MTIFDFLDYSTRSENLFIFQRMLCFFKYTFLKDIEQRMNNERPETKDFKMFLNIIFEISNI